MMKFYKAFRSTYWSYADWVYKFKSTTKRNFYSIGDMFAELDKPKPLIDAFLNGMQDAIYMPLDFIYSINVYVSNRFKTKTHLLTSNLEVGMWHEYSERVLSVLSDSFINWMETEYCNSDKPNPEKMVEKHLWEVSLKRDESMGVESDSEIYNTPSNQAIGSKKLFEIYQYFKYQRPSIVKYALDTYMGNENVWNFSESYEELDTKYLNMIIENRMSMWN